MSRKLNPTAITCLIFLIAAASATAAFNDYSMLFDGTNEQFNLSTPGLNNFSASGWVKCFNVANYGGIISWTVGTDRRAVYVDIDGLPGIVFGANQYATRTSGAIDNNTWHHIVSTYNGTTPKVYVDGTEVTINTPLAAGAGEINVCRIGSMATTSGFRFVGNIDEVSAWNKVLSSNEVSEIYNNGYPGNLLSHSAQTNLVSWWRMGDGATWDETNWTIPDQKGTNNGTSVNMEEDDRSTDALSPPTPSGTMFMAR